MAKRKKEKEKNKKVDGVKYSKSTTYEFANKFDSKV